MNKFLQKYTNSRIAGDNNQFTMKEIRQSKFDIEPLQYRLGRIGTQVLILLALYAACRIIFIASNSEELELNGISEYMNIMIHGMRFDLSAIALTNGLYLLLVLVPAPFSGNKYYLRFNKSVFLLVNAACIIMNLIDAAYFPFIHRRSQSDLFLFFTGEKGSDMFRLLPTFLREHWILFIPLFLIIAVLVRTARKTTQLSEKRSGTLKTYLTSATIYLLSIGVLVIMIRGGLQKKPLNIIHASAAASVKNMPAVLNSPFSVYKTFNKKSLTELRYMDENELKPLNGGIHRPEGIDPFRKKNIVVIIVESMSRNYLGYFGGPAKTPFLDSLFARSLVFTNAFANGKQSIEGIPAILSSIPSWQDENFIFSPYAGNKITSLANLLGEEGYETSFFHGGFNGTMGFDAYCGLAGFRNYYGKNEYDKNGNDANEWGIWDEKFLEFAEQKMSANAEPFFASIFTLNTHHPFDIPAEYRQVFNRPGHPILNCFSYVDYSLRRFFDLAKKEKWFNNTLFVITADHTGPNIEDTAAAPLDDYRIPLAFFSGDGSLSGQSDIIANQIDILPSVLQWIRYPKPYFSFGKSVFDSSAKRCSIQYNQGIYQCTDSAYCLRFDGSRAIGIYSWKEDPLFRKNIIMEMNPGDKDYLDRSLKMNIQFFNACMLRNQMNAGSMESK